MPDRIWDFHDVILEVLESHSLKMIQYSRIVWRAGQPKEHFVSNQEYRLLLEDESGQQSTVTFLLDDESSNKSVRSELESGLEET